MGIKSKKRLTRGCGLGVLFHYVCWLMGVFVEDLLAVKKRMKEFFSSIWFLQAWRFPVVGTM